MPVIGINIRSMSSEREENIQGNLRVNNSPQIKGVSKKSVGQLNKDALSIDFEYACGYQVEDEDKEVASIEMAGEVLFLAEDPEEKVEKWEENKELDDDIVIPVINSVMRKCMTQAIDISEELQLPPPIQFPRAQKKSGNARYIG